MSELKKCSRCRSEIQLKYFAMNRKGEYNKTCETCLNKTRKTKQPLKRTDTDFVDEDKSTTAETNSISEPIDEKYIIVMDVETNGLIKQRGLTPNKNNLDYFPRIVQFSWGLYTEDGECKEMKDFIIKPDGWNMNGKEKFHGITQERALNEGVDIKDVLTEYKNDIDNHCCKLVCHNLNFDKTVVMSELMRLDMNVNDVESFCTMKNTINYCKLTPMVRGEYKWPSLEQLYYKCFNEDIDNAHNSKYDVINTAKCYFKYQLL